MTEAVAAELGATYDQVLARLDEQGIGHRSLTLQDGSLLVVSQRGARIYGPFWTPSAASANWMPDAFVDADTFAALVKSQHWNVGGERVWVGPEIQYMIPDRSDYWGSYVLPAAMDPGVNEWTSHDSCELNRRIKLAGYSIATGETELQMTLDVELAADPLRYLERDAELRARVDYAGYVQRVSMRHIAGEPLLSESWNLAQVRPGGVALIPATTAAQITDYYEPSDGAVSTVEGGVAGYITGDRRYKIGVKSAHVHGRVGYYRLSPNGEASLLVRNFANDPSSVYAEEPDFAPGVLGDSIHLYNDDGGLGGFGELEARGRTIGGATTRTHAVDEFTSWWFRGAPADLNRVAMHLLGMSIETHPG